MRADQVTMSAIFLRLGRELRSLFMLSRLSDERGQTMAEYGILVAVIALVVVVAAITLGSNISSAFHNAATKV
jgi:pilus assembly protein Flp/PilA